MVFRRAIDRGCGVVSHIPITSSGYPLIGINLSQSIVGPLRSGAVTLNGTWTVDRTNSDLDSACVSSPIIT